MKAIQQAAILSVGDEILIGQIVNTNTVWLAAELNKRGMEVREMLTVGDHANQIRQALEYLCDKYALVLITGGLGPTPDDLTKPVLCELTGSVLVRNVEAEKVLLHYLKTKKRELTGVNQAQADLPDQCEPLHNYWGTAPGMWFEFRNSVIISLPGVPLEMKNIMETSGFPKLEQKFRLSPLLHRTLWTEGIPEAQLYEKIADWENKLPEGISLAYLPAAGQVRLRLSARNHTPELENMMQQAIDELHKLIPGEIFGEGNTSLAEVIYQLLKEKNLTISTAESCSGGYLAHLITSVPGVSEVFPGSVVSYSNELKMKLLGVDAEILAAHGAVSQPVAEAMAIGVKNLTGSDYSLATTGIAGPSGGSAEKPVGTVWIACSGPHGVISRCYHFGDQRDINIQRTALSALGMLRKVLLNFPV